MFELLIGIAIVVFLAGTALFLFFVPADMVLFIGSVLVALGLAVGLPTGLMYHFKLFKELKPMGIPIKTWLWFPTRMHDLLAPSQKDYVLGFFYWGAFGFLVIMVGCFLLFLGAMTI